MTTPAVAPYVPFYASAAPYITTGEFLAAPTGVDTTQLIPGGMPAANGDALATVIRRASSYADRICHQVLAATSDLESGQFRVQRGGVLRIPMSYSPVVEVSAVSVGRYPNGLTALTDLSGVWINRKVIDVPVYGVFSTLTSDVPAAGARPGYLYAQVQYVNGYANTTLAADAAVGASSVTVASALGVFAGMPLTICDDTLAGTEQVTVDASYVQGSTTVPLVGTLTAAHTAGTAVTALPESVKQAVVHLTAHLIKTRGAEAISLAGLSGGPAAVQKLDPGGDVDLAAAQALLAPFARVR